MRTQHDANRTYRHRHGGVIVPATDAWTILGALAAVVAAIFAALAWRQGRTAAKQLGERYEREVEPIPRLVTYDADREAMVVSNTGGAARQVVVLWDHRERPGTVIIAGGAVPASSTGVELPARFFRGSPSADVPQPAVRIAAKDLLNRWWNCNTRQRVEWGQWWAEAAAALGIPDVEADESADGQTMIFSRETWTDR